MRILIAEDDLKITKVLVEGLKLANYISDIAYEGEEAIYMALTNHYSVVILDYNLPKKNGIEVLKAIRKENLDVKVIMLTAVDDVETKVECLENGADDYVVKPFSIKELLARIRVMIRRQDQQKDTQLMLVDLTLDLKKMKCVRGNKNIKLSSQEFSVLELLMRHQNEIVTRDMLSEHIWGEDAFGYTNKIEVYISYLRSKIDKDFDIKLLKTIRGRGYILGGDE